jgi:glyceraldehyde 3-phosphate dehydrogenase
MNIIPTTTGAARALSLVIPAVKGKLDGIAFRVPTPTVSVIDLVVATAKEVTRDSVNEAFRKAAAGELKGIMEYCEEELVSLDFKGNSHSSIIDAPSTMVVAGNMVKVLAWYDNEWGYSCRLGDLAVFIAGKGL